MSEFVAGAVRIDEGYGRDAAAFDVFLFPQGDSAAEVRSDVALPYFSFPSFSDRPASSESASGNIDTGLVTIGDYLFFDGQKAHRLAVGARKMASRMNRAGQRAEKIDALGIDVLEGELKAGCDAGKGASELTAGSLAGRNASVGPKAMRVEAKETE